MDLNSPDERTGRPSGAFAGRGTMDERRWTMDDDVFSEIRHTRYSISTARTTKKTHVEDQKLLCASIS